MQLALSQWSHRKHRSLYDTITTILAAGSPQDVGLALVDTVFELFVSVLGPNSRNEKLIRGWVAPFDLRAAIWTLDMTTVKPSFLPSETITNTNDGEEAVFYPDNRTPVAPDDYKDGGKYRCESFRFALNMPLD